MRLFTWVPFVAVSICALPSYSLPVKASNLILRTDSNSIWGPKILPRVHISRLHGNPAPDSRPSSIHSHESHAQAIVAPLAHEYEFSLHTGITNVGQKAPIQGTKSIVYSVNVWKDSNGRQFRAIAKTLKGENDCRTTMSQEVVFLKRVGQYVEDGVDSHGRYWVIMKDVRAQGTPFRLPEILHKTRTKDECDAAVEKAMILTVKRSMEWTREHVLNLDVHPDNVFFDADLTKAELVDWGGAIDGKPDAHWLEELQAAASREFKFDVESMAICDRKPQPGPSDQKSFWNHLIEKVRGAAKWQR